MRRINPADYMHDTDEKTLEQLKQIPGFSAALKAFMQIWNEKQQHVLNMSSKVRLGPNQLPELYNLLPPIVEAFGIDEPEFYLQWSHTPNAYTAGDAHPYVCITTALVNTVPTEQLIAVLAHECSHIACHHILYHTMGAMILSEGINFLGLDLLAKPLVMAFLAWQRASELSCDRAAALYLGDSKPVIQMMMSLAAGSPNTSSKLNMDEYIKQAEAYNALSDDMGLNKLMKFLATVEEDHPLLAVRAYEIKKWCESDEFKNIMNRTQNIAALPGDGICPRCGKEVSGEWAFCKSCGQKLK